MTQLIGGKVSPFKSFLRFVGIHSLLDDAKQAGGKDESVQGVGSELAKVDEAVEAARSFATKHLQ